MGKYMKWPRDDLKKLERLYPTTPNDELELEFAPRPLSSVLSMANHLGLRRSRDWKAIAQAYVPVIFGARRG